MPDCMPADIIIGGEVTRSQWDRMVGAEPTLACFDPVTHEDSSGLIDFQDHVNLHDPDAAWGHFEELEQVLREEGIAYDRNANAANENDGEEASWRPGMDCEILAPGRQDGGGVMVEAEVIVDYLASGLTLEQVIAEADAPNGLRLVCLRREQPLPAFEFVEAEEAD